jgi:hypothetical protein
MLTDIEGTLEATLLDDELETARELLKAKHLRSAGIVAGVVLERHLKTVLANHNVSLGRNRRKSGTSTMRSRRRPSSTFHAGERSRGSPTFAISAATIRSESQPLKRFKN